MARSHTLSSSFFSDIVSRFAVTTLGAFCLTVITFSGFAMAIISLVLLSVERFSVEHISVESLLGVSASVISAVERLSVTSFSGGAVYTSIKAATQAAASQGHSFRRRFCPFFLTVSCSIRRIILSLMSVGIEGRAISSCRIASRRQSFMLAFSFIIVYF